MDKVLRQLAMVRHIPRAPRKRAAEDIRDALEAEGFPTTLRTVQRDLMKLSALFPIASDERAKPYGWQWMADAEALDLPAMNMQLALTFMLVRDEMRQLLPPATVSWLDPYFARAETVLSSGSDEAWADWREKVRVVPPGMRLLPPAQEQASLNTVYEALRLGKRIRARYRNKAGDVAEREITPLGLIWRGHLGYLACRFYDYPDPRTLALHRLSHAELLDKDAADEPFNLDAFIEAGGVDVSAGETVKLMLRMRRQAAAHLEETPLAEDQVIEAIDDDWVRVRATVLDSSQLRWWLLGLAHSLVVEEPAALEAEITEGVQQAAAIRAS